MKLVSSFLFFIILLSNQAKCQIDSLHKNRFLNIQTGIGFDNFNSAGIRFRLEYSKQLKKKLYYGTLFEMKKNQYRHTTDYYPIYPANTFILAEKIGYRFELWRDRIAWNVGLAAGVAYLQWPKHNLLRPIAVADATLNIRITKKLYLETAPLIIILPVSTFYFSFIGYKEYDNYGGISVPIGLRYKF
ncbi:MAG: hypothetical protein ACRCVT_02110 [Leadbetterella sp.]